MAPAARGSVGHRVGGEESTALLEAGQGTGTRGGWHRGMSPRGAGGEAAGTVTRGRGDGGEPLTVGSVLEGGLGDALRQQLGQDVVQVVGIGIAVTRQVGAEFGLVMDLVPHHRV